MADSALWSLSRMQFPECTKSALNLLSSKRSVYSSTELQKLVKENVFGCKYSIGSGDHEKSEIDELNALLTVSRFLEDVKDFDEKQILFEILFFSDQFIKEYLGKLLSLAVSLQHSDVLSCAAQWLAQNESSLAALSVVRRLVEDYISLMPESASTLKHCITFAPSFAYEFLNLSLNLIESGDLSSDQVTELLNLACGWYDAVPTLPLQSERKAENLFVPVVRAVLLFEFHSFAPSVAHQLAHLHVLVLQSLQACREHPQKHRLIDDESLQSLISELSGVLSQPDGATKAIPVERLGQILQMARATGILQVDGGKLRLLCQKLPPHRILDIVLQ